MPELAVVAVLDVVVSWFLPLVGGSLPLIVVAESEEVHNIRIQASWLVDELSGKARALSLSTAVLFVFVLLAS